MKTISIFSIVLLCGMFGSCKKDTTNSHITTTVTYTPPANTQYDVYSLDGNINLTLTTSQNQVVGTAILTQPGVADLGAMPDGTYTISATAEEKDYNPTYGVTAFRTRQSTCTVTLPSVNHCSIALD